MAMTNWNAGQEAREIVERALARYELIPLIAAALQRRDAELARVREEFMDVTRLAAIHAVEMSVLKAQHEAALREVSEWQRDFTTLSKACGGILGAEKTKRGLAEAQRESERLREERDHASVQAGVNADIVHRMREEVARLKKENVGLPKKPTPPGEEQERSTPAPGGLGDTHETPPAACFKEEDCRTGEKCG